MTSAALWMNEQASADDLITCIQLTPHHDAGSNSLYIQVNTIIPVPGTEDLSIGIGDREDSGGGSNGGLGEALRRSFAQSISHEATPFLRGVADIVQEDLPEAIRPDRRSRWAGKGGWAGEDHRYYHMWYTRPPWGNWTTSYRVDLYEGETSRWRADVHFATQVHGLMDRLQDSNIHGRVPLDGEELNESFANEIADTLSNMIKSITPIVDEFEDENNEEEA